MPIVPPAVTSNYSSGFNKTIFGELHTSELHPIAQITATYGLLDNVRTIEVATGTSTSSDKMFVCQTGTHPVGLATIQSDRHLSYRAGQGAMCRFTALFTQGVTNSAQIAGLFHSEDRLCFGYDGDTFGVLYAHNGATESQTLTLTAGTVVGETATVTVNNVAYSVPLTAGGIDHNAYEIAVSMSQQDPFHLYSSVGATVSSVSIIDGTEGTYAFSSAVASGSWVQDVAGVPITESWTPVPNWNGTIFEGFDPTKGNVYQIQYQYLGFGAIRFAIENPKTGIFETCHTIEYSNANILPSVTNPNFRFGWACQNRGNTTNLTVKGASAGAFLEGLGVPTEDSRGLSVNVTGVGATETTLLTMRNPTIFNGRTNRQEIEPLLLSLATDTSQTAIFTVRANPVVTGDLIFQVTGANSLMEYATDNRAVTGGRVLFEFVLTKEGPLTVDLMQRMLFIPSEIITISARVSQGAASGMQAGFTWRDSF